MAGKVRKT